MIKVTIPKTELFDEKNNEFFYPVKNDVVLKLEHSLISIQKWEAKHHKAFLSKTKKTPEETLDYIRCMSLTEIDDEKLIKYLPTSEVDRVLEYIDNSMTATVFGEDILNDKNKIGKGRDTVTAEVIYYYMIALNIPSEYKKWHLNQLMTLIKTINLENDKINNTKKRSKTQILSDYDRLNTMRREKLNSKG